MLYKDNNFPVWENTAIEPDKMTLKQFLDYLTDINWHTERCVVEAIIDGRDSLIDRACKVRLKHSEDGHLTDENWKEREAIYKAIEGRE